MNSLETPFCEVMENIWEQKLSTQNCKFKKNFTFTVYVVSPDYAIQKADPIEFTLNTKAILEKQAKIYFASTKLVEGDIYRSVGTSRLFAVHTSGNTLEEAREKAYAAIENNMDSKLDYRTDIGEIYEH